MIILTLCHILLTCSILSLIIGIFGKSKNSEQFLGAGILATPLVLILGYGVICYTIPIREEITTLIPQEIAKSQYTLYLTCNGKTFNSTDARIVMTDTNLIRVQKTTQFNSYNKPMLGETYLLGETYQLIVIEEPK